MKDMTIHQVGSQVRIMFPLTKGHRVALDEDRQQQKPRGTKRFAGLEEGWVNSDAIPTWEAGALYSVPV